MPGIRGWFGRGAAKKQEDTPKNAILGLRAQLESLRKRETHLVNQIEEQHIIARESISTNKKTAKAALRRKKAHQHSLDETIARIRTLELFASPDRPVVERPSKKGPHTPTKKPQRHNSARRSHMRSIGLREFIRNWFAN